MQRGGAMEGGAVAGPSSRPARRFPLAAPPEIMRAAEKDEQYASFVSDACCDAFRRIFGINAADVYQSETKLLGQTLYYLMTTGSGKQTLGEEYCDITQVAGPHGLPPTPARRMLFIIYQAAVPYLAERIRSRMVAHENILSDLHSEVLSIGNMLERNQAQSSVRPERSSSSATDTHISVFSKLRMKFYRLWLQAVQNWPSVLPYAREVLQLILRTNLMLFYFEGLYYHISKRAAGIRYVFIGKLLNQRPRYQILGVFLLVQLCILGAERLRQSNLTSTASASDQTSLASQQHTTARGLPILDEEGMLVSDSDPNKLQALGGMGKCPLCLSPPDHPTATLCGHIFCWKCIMACCNQNLDCPNCRTQITHSSLICLYHMEF